MKHLLTLSVNGETYEMAIDPRRTLSDVLRTELGLTGTKEGCGTGDCGACTVLMDGKPILSCLTLAMDARDRDILTIEGLSPDGHLHPLQKAMVEEGAVQCGFCTPGMILSAKGLLEIDPDPDEEDVKNAIAGNLCRCTGYNKIVEAIMAAAKICRQADKE